jgi:hypothetical protein
MKPIKIKTTHMAEFLKELEALRLKPEQHYELSWVAETLPILQFTDPKHELLWRVAVGYKYT